MAACPNRSTAVFSKSLLLSLFLIILLPLAVLVFALGWLLRWFQSSHEVETLTYRARRAEDELRQTSGEGVALQEKGSGSAKAGSGASAADGPLGIATARSTGGTSDGKSTTAAGTKRKPAASKTKTKTKKKTTTKRKPAASRTTTTKRKPAASKKKTAAATTKRQPAASKTKTAAKRKPATKTKTTTRKTSSKSGSAGDDLTLINGVGPVLSKKLKALGFKTFESVANMRLADIARVEQSLNFPGRIRRDGWIKQARTLAGRK